MAVGPVVVTGASGFVGGHLCRTLAASGSVVRAVFRRPPEGELPSGVTAFVANPADPKELGRIVAGAGAVVHLAARVHIMRDHEVDPLSAFRGANVELTRKWAEAAARAGVQTFVFASSVKVMGEASGVPFKETDIPRPTDPYGISKLEAEQALREISRRTGLKTASLRLPLVYGAGVRANLRSMMRAIYRGVPLPLGGIQNRRSLLFTGNFCEAVAAVLGKPPSGAREYFVADNEDVSTPELVTRLAGAMERPVRLLPFPEQLMRMGAAVGDRLPLWTRFPLRTTALARLTGSLAVDCSLLRRESGYCPRFSVTEGLRATADWFRTTGGGS